ncbi:MAG: prepilin peptidase [Acidimicrobiales bacterium]|nr:prepilin peptidase [Acidimicrobiales bacterium]
MASDAQPFAVGAALLAGLIVGSFLNVVAYRVPRGRSINRPRSACPACNTTLTWWENVPVASWLLLHGRCRTCRAPISLRYPAVELGTGVAFAWVTWASHVSLASVGYCLLAATMIAIALIETGGARPPFGVAVVGTVLGLMAFGLAALWSGDARAFLGPLVGVAIGAVLLLVGRLVGQHAVDRADEDRSGPGFSWLLVAGCWFGGLPLAPLVAGGLTAAAGCMLVLSFEWSLARQRVGTLGGGASTTSMARTAGLTALLPVVVGVAMVVALGGQA